MRRGRRQNLFRLLYRFVFGDVADFDDELEYHKYAAVGASAIRDLNRLLALSGSDAQPSSFDAPAGSGDNPEAVLDAAIGQLAVADAGHATSTPPP